MDEKIKRVKDKIGRWLREENISPSEALDPQALFNFHIQPGNLNIVQMVDWRDSIVVDKSAESREEAGILLGSEFRIIEKRSNWRF